LDARLDRHEGNRMATVREGSRSVLLVVDVQVGVVRNAWQVADVVQRLVQAVARARAQGVAVIWVQHQNERLVPGSADWQWVPELVPAAAESRIAKRFNSAFEQTELEALLAGLGATRIVLAGAASNWCIRATAHAALERGYDLTLLADAHTTTDMDCEDGTRIAAADIVRELNVAMTWLDYPGRHNSKALPVG
jgi:nicotinamidase-related amidase